MYIHFSEDIMGYCKVIRNLREDHDLTQSYIANQLGVCQRTYADYELGKTRIPVESLIKLAKFYNVDMDYICGLSLVPMPFQETIF